MTEKYSDFYKCFFIRLPAGTKYLHRKTRTNNLMFLFPCFECHENLTKDCFFFYLLFLILASTTKMFDLEMRVKLSPCVVDTINI